MQALLGIDIGTSGCKALLIGIDGAVIAADTASYPLSQPQLGWLNKILSCGSRGRVERGRSIG
ncbi:hypothetical protein A8M57_07010 [Yersinia pestis]|nr:hypothetical protein A8M57_07010 [Yersinia pestis]